MHARMLSMRPGATHGRENVFLVRGGSPLRLALASESLAQLSSVLPLAALIPPLQKIGTLRTGAAVSSPHPCDSHPCDSHPCDSRAARISALLRYAPHSTPWAHLHAVAAPDTYDRANSRRAPQATTPSPCTPNKTTSHGLRAPERPQRQFVPLLRLSLIHI